MMTIEDGFTLTRDEIADLKSELSDLDKTIARLRNERDGLLVDMTDMSEDISRLRKALDEVMPWLDECDTEFGCNASDIARSALTTTAK